MSDPSLAVQSALVAALKALSTEAGARVYDLPSAYAAVPYITVGGGQKALAAHHATRAQPFFFPAYRAHRKSAQAAIRKATRMAARKVASGV